MNSEMMDTTSFGPADMTQILDRIALDEGMIGENEVFDTVCLELDGPTDELGPQLRIAVRKLLQMRVANERDFDVACLKILCPRMTHADLTEVMNAMKKANWTHRARSCEAMKRIVARFPELDGALLMDRRGGSDNRKLTGAQLLREYEELKTAEKARPLAMRRKCKGDDGLLHELACRHAITGVFGKPSWEAVRKRIVRHKAGQGDQP